MQQRYNNDSVQRTAIAGRQKRIVGDQEMNGKRLIHYTSNLDALVSILYWGFLLIPNRRGLIQRFLSPDMFRDREPQQFGMTCFTEMPTEYSASHRQEFGNFGIGVKWDWAFRHCAQRVIYVSETGPIAETFALLFQYASREIDALVRNFPADGARSAAYMNKNLAQAMGCPLYAAMLGLYEYMQPDAHSSQVEWRIVQKLPHYMKANLDDKPGLIREALLTAKTWGTTAVRILPSDIEVFICPTDGLRELKARVPQEFSSVPVIGIST